MEGTTRELDPNRAKQRLRAFGGELRGLVEKRGGGFLMHHGLDRGALTAISLVFNGKM